MIFLVRVKLRPPISEDSRTSKMVSNERHEQCYLTDLRLFFQTFNIYTSLETKNVLRVRVSSRYKLKVVS